MLEHRVSEVELPGKVFLSGGPAWLMSWLYQSNKGYDYFEGLQVWLEYFWKGCICFLFCLWRLLENQAVSGTDEQLLCSLLYQIYIHIPSTPANELKITFFLQVVQLPHLNYLISQANPLLILQRSLLQIQISILSHHQWCIDTPVGISSGLILSHSFSLCFGSNWRTGTIAIWESFKLFLSCPNDRTCAHISRTNHSYSMERLITLKKRRNPS